MTDKRAQLWCFSVVTAMLWAVAGAAAASGADATPTPTPAPTRTPIVITNDNLADYAARGRVTSADGGSKSGTGKSRRPIHEPGTDASKRKSVDAVESAGEMAADEKKRRWRSTYQKQIELVASIEEQIGKLDWEIPGLWRDFYAWDDPAYRDGVIKPKLDEALVRRQRLEDQLTVEQEHLDTIRRDARKDGAQPGWFRGIEKPTPRPREP
jgi:hypothetical protein